MICYLCCWFGFPFYRSRLPDYTLALFTPSLISIWRVNTYRKISWPLFSTFHLWIAYGIELILTSYFVPFSLHPPFVLPFPISLSTHILFFLKAFLPHWFTFFPQRWTSKRWEQGKTDKYIYGVGWNIQHSYWDCLCSVYTLMSVS